MLETLQKRIQELVPEIMELKRGCKILIEGSEEITRFICEEERKNGKVWVISPNEKSYGVCPKPSYVRILGRDITLEDILVAIDEAEITHLTAGELNKKLALFLKLDWVDENNHHYTGAKWQLNTPLHLQSEETIKFLSELLVKE